MNKVIEERTKRTEWYRDARFGMFIHWGLYAIPARGEWVRSVEQIPHEDYCHLTEEFTAENYNPRERNLLLCPLANPLTEIHV